MKNGKIPQWLEDVQNKSWEPEILISGITLTFVFFLSNHIYNFFGMLIQDYGVFRAVGTNLYMISVVAITGLKIILVFHLILRGLWTGVVGLSYAFPNGVKEENLSKTNKHLKFSSIDVVIIKLEKICSIMFSFIFSSIWAGIVLFLYFIPLILLSVIGIDKYYISIISLIYSALTFVVVLFFLIRIKIFKKSRLEQKLSNSIFNLIFVTYITNLGKIRTYLLFYIYFLFIFVIAFNSIFNFNFNNRKGISINNLSNVVEINYDKYSELRDHSLRFPKSIIDSYNIKDNKFSLNISVYKEDFQILPYLEPVKLELEKFGFQFDSTNILSIKDLYVIKLDDKVISGLDWHIRALFPTKQKVLVTTVNLDSLNKGLHQIKIDKFYYRVLHKEFKIIKDWDVIPFKLE